MLGHATSNAKNDEQQWQRSLNSFRPWMRQYFIKSKREHGNYSYSKAQKLVCLKALQLVNIYDDMLFANFIKDVESALKDDDQL